jgi:hypothetical protein
MSNSNIINYLKYYLKNYPELFYLIKKINRIFISFSNFIYPTRIFESERLLFKKIFPYCKIFFDVGARFDVDYIEISKKIREREREGGSN